MYQCLKSFRAAESVYSSSSLHNDNVNFSNDLAEIYKRKIEDLIRNFDIFLIL